MFLFSLTRPINHDEEIHEVHKQALLIPEHNENGIRTIL